MVVVIFRPSEETTATPINGIVDVIKPSESTLQSKIHDISLKKIPDDCVFSTSMILTMFLLAQLVLPLSSPVTCFFFSLLGGCHPAPEKKNHMRLILNSDCSALTLTCF